MKRRGTIYKHYVAASWEDTAARTAAMYLINLLVYFTLPVNLQVKI